MSQVVQARCPHCRNVLRIPAEWVSRPMRCKYCGQTFQGRAPARTSPAVTAQPAASPRATPAVNGVSTRAPAAAGDPFAFHADEPALSQPGRYRRRPTRWWIGALLLAAVAGVGAAVYFVAGPHLGELFSS